MVSAPPKIDKNMNFFLRMFNFYENKRTISYTRKLIHFTKINNSQVITLSYFLTNLKQISPRKPLTHSIFILQPIAIKSTIDNPRTIILDFLVWISYLRYTVKLCCKLKTNPGQKVPQNRSRTVCCKFHSNRMQNGKVMDRSVISVYSPIFVF